MNSDVHCISAAGIPVSVKMVDRCRQIQLLLQEHLQLDGGCLVYCPDPEAIKKPLRIAQRGVVGFFRAFYDSHPLRRRPFGDVGCHALSSMTSSAVGTDQFASGECAAGHGHQVLTQHWGYCTQGDTFTMYLLAKRFGVVVGFVDERTKKVRLFNPVTDNSKFIDLRSLLVIQVVFEYDFRHSFPKKSSKLTADFPPRVMARAASTVNPQGGYSAAIGHNRSSQEDRTIVIPDLRAAGGEEPDATKEKIAYFGLFDGHLGAGTADFLEKNLHLLVHEQLTILEGSGQAADMVKAIKGGLDEAELHTKEKVRRAGRSAAAVPDEPEYCSGSTAVVVTVHGNTLTVANLGDSRCILSRGGRPHTLTLDHRLSDPVACHSPQLHTGTAYVGDVRRQSIFQDADSLVCHICGRGKHLGTRTDHSSTDAVTTDTITMTAPCTGGTVCTGDGTVGATSSIPVATPYINTGNVHTTSSSKDVASLLTAPSGGTVSGGAAVLNPLWAFSSPFSSSSSSSSSGSVQSALNCEPSSTTNNHTAAAVAGAVSGSTVVNVPLGSDINSDKRLSHWNTFNLLLCPNTSSDDNESPLPSASLTKQQIRSTITITGTSQQHIAVRPTEGRVGVAVPIHDCHAAVPVLNVHHSSNCSDTFASPVENILLSSSVTSTCSYRQQKDFEAASFKNYESSVAGQSSGAGQSSVAGRRPRTYPVSSNCSECSLSAATTHRRQRSDSVYNSTYTADPQNNDDQATFK
eukprot:Lankesteria_metandrocarpae@DN5137_c1_g1_i1.p1